MRLRHHIPIWAIKPEQVTEEYQAEVDRSTDKAMVAYQRARRRLESAERRLQAAQDAATATQRKKNEKAIARELAVAAELVELRREELQRIEALMMSVPASAQHRGRESYRPVPAPGRQV